ncbi:MAG: 4Fe-4S binding protein [Calditrichaeota bacterium]|nr:MAG: 4Fe-4S binding protein [Calditrichota bacterium]
MNATTPYFEETHEHKDLSGVKKIGLALVSLGFLLLFVSASGIAKEQPTLFSILIFGSIMVGTLVYVLPQLKEGPAGIKNNNIFFDSMTSKGAAAWVAGIFITGFYVLLYWFPQYLENWIRILDPLSFALSGGPASQWFLYGTFYTIAVVFMGVRMIVKYRHNRYQIIRTASVMFFQLGFGFLIPNILKAFNQPEFYFTYFWPLKYDYLFPNSFEWLMSSGGIGIFMFFWGAVMTFIATPVLTYFFGKRWYCSWVCGCGGLAETLGDPYRQLSDKSLKAWQIERWMIHGVLAFITVTTIIVWLNSSFGGGILGDLSNQFSQTYGFLIGAAFSGVIGVGFYPIMGSRVWCRFGCPMAAVLGIIQKFWSRFRITTNGGQCISCGNCSTYCEMGIDVRAYAQRGQNIIRASCVGCGICAAVCPRGVLKLENGKVEGRYELNDYVKV